MTYGPYAGASLVSAPARHRSHQPGPTQQPVVRTHRMKTPQHPSTPDAARRRLLQAMGAASVAGIPAWAGAQGTAQVNTTRLAVTDTEVTVGQLHSSTGTMAISETGSIQA